MTYAQRLMCWSREIEEHKPQIMFLYEQKRLTLRNVAKEMKTCGCTFSYRYLHAWLKEYGYVHKSGPANGRGKPVRQRDCVICHESFLPASSQQRHCRKCIPDGKAYHHWKTYGLTVEQFDAMLSDQENTCPGCNRDFASLTNVKNDVPHVDHCHLTNEIRGLLCRSCNHVLGLAEDSSETLRNLAAYIEAFKSRPKETSHLSVVRSLVRNP